MHSVLEVHYLYFAGHVYLLGKYDCSRSSENTSVLQRHRQVKVYLSFFLKKKPSSVFERYAACAKRVQYLAA